MNVHGGHGGIRTSYTKFKKLFYISVLIVFENSLYSKCVSINVSLCVSVTYLFYN